VWSWDITKLPGHRRGDYLDQYMIVDIYIYAPHWLVVEAESGGLAKAFIADAICCNGGSRPTRCMPTVAPH
jgi:hypothetical protein